MSKHVDIDPIIDSIYAKWGCDPTYYIDDVERGCEALDDAELIEMLRSRPESVVRCKDCRYAIKVKDTGIPDLYLCRAETNPNYKSANGFCDSGAPREDRKKDDGR